MDIRKLGVLGFVDGFRGPQVVEFARKVEQLGYSVLWVPDVMGREIFSLSAQLLGQTERLIVGTGVAIIYAYEPVAVAAASNTLGEFFEDRFILGLGVSNHTYNVKRGIGYQQPVTFMREYLEKMKATPYVAPPPQHHPPIVLAGMMPKMLQLSATATKGTLTYLTTTEQVARAREALGPRAWLCAVQVVILEADAAKARSIARRYIATYLAIEHYLYRLRRLGFTDSDFANGGSDRLVDALIAWGKEDTIRQRIADQFTAGATHVSILPIDPNGGRAPDMRALEALAPR
ncbi:MAG: TIGR03620 family F420-dependent LLM class oxidoreductase [Candidatus Binatia bacterium]